MNSPRRSITVTSEGEQSTFTGDVDIRKTAFGTYYILWNGKVAWQQRVHNGQKAAVELKFEGFDEEFIKSITGR
ncbi:hypothetical protein JK358_38185 [Nocardia sp. 2]|uniref:Uncharacterized protein n=1 Tax=Nocardia acididurans TaxID=2802282 RepID=A0ABS1MIZ1_9NOCA|nr:hypothetical protein [Nocardia acididurans]MBL1080241.1 hypothetical protein [Nocardia acididurans]